MNNAITLPSDNLLSVTYYDDYSFLDGKAFGKELAYRDAARALKKSSFLKTKTKNAYDL